MINRRATWLRLVVATCGIFSMTLVTGCGGGGSEPTVDQSQVLLDGASDVDQKLEQLGPDVQFLDLSGSSVTDQQLGKLQSFTNLTDLILRQTAITDQALANLSGMTQLTYLDLSGTQITDAGLASLQTLSSLNYLYLKDTAVSVKAAGRLKDAIPNANIDLISEFQ